MKLLILLTTLVSINSFAGTKFDDLSVKAVSLCDEYYNGVFSVTEDRIECWYTNGFYPHLMNAIAELQ